MGAEDDGYNAKAPYDFRRRGGWNYQVISWPDTEPGSPEGQRHLEIPKVDYSGYAPDSFEEAQFGCIGIIEGREDWHTAGAPAGKTVEHLLIELKRMEAAVERPAISWDEWQAGIVRNDSEAVAEVITSMGHAAADLAPAAARRLDVAQARRQLRICRAHRRL